MLFCVDASRQTQWANYSKHSWAQKWCLTFHVSPADCRRSTVRTEIRIHRGNRICIAGKLLLEFHCPQIRAHHHHHHRLGGTVCTQHQWNFNYRSRGTDWDHACMRCYHPLLSTRILVRSDGVLTRYRSRLQFLHINKIAETAWSSLYTIYTAYNTFIHKTICVGVCSRQQWIASCTYSFFFSVKGPLNQPTIQPAIAHTVKPKLELCYDELYVCYRSGTIATMEKKETPCNIRNNNKRVCKGSHMTAETTK